MTCPVSHPRTVSPYATLDGQTHTPAARHTGDITPPNRALVAALEYNAAAIKGMLSGTTRVSRQIIGSIQLSKTTQDTLLALFWWFSPQTCRKAQEADS